jgi:hypothetical protein
MTDFRIDGIEDPLAALADLINALVIVKNPVESLLRRRNIVAMRAEADDRCLDFPNIELNTVAGDDLASREFVTNKESVVHPLLLFAAQEDKIAPPLFKLQIAVLLLFRVSPNVVLLGP